MRPERRPRGRNDGAAQAALPATFWRESAKSQGFGDRVPKDGCLPTHSPKIDGVILSVRHANQLAHLQYEPLDMW